ncbi:hypothetical protein ACF05T_22995 [Streptomyces lateritius]|uniref:Uncharacterized protein n=1 Tax=Streptomyces lateritius TaxID=67313 RepID=A0ABW6YGS9_9ACTN
MGWLEAGQRSAGRLGALSATAVKFVHAGAEGWSYRSISRGFDAEPRGLCRNVWLAPS